MPNKEFSNKRYKILLDESSYVWINGWFKALLESMSTTEITGDSLRLGAIAKDFKNAKIITLKKGNPESKDSDDETDKDKLIGKL